MPPTREVRSLTCGLSGNPTGDALKAIVSVRDADPPTGSQPRCRSTPAGAPDHPRQPLAFVVRAHAPPSLASPGGSQDKTRRMISPQPARLRSPSAGRRAKVAGRGTGRKDDDG